MGLLDQLDPRSSWTCWSGCSHPQLDKYLTKDEAAKTHL